MLLAKKLAQPREKIAQTCLQRLHVFPSLYLAPIPSDLWPHFLDLTQKEQRPGRAGCTQATLFPYDCGVSSAKTPFGPVSGAHGPKRVTGNGRKRPSATGRKAVAGPFMNQSEKFQWVKRSKFRWLRARLSRFSRGWPQKGPFGPFLGPGGSGADPKTPIWPPRENCCWKWVQPN